LLHTQLAFLPSLALLLALARLSMAFRFVTILHACVALLLGFRTTLLART
jgi:hypothetical protein